jgi:hypothetical protein
VLDICQLHDDGTDACASACQLASTTFSRTPTVVPSRVRSVVSTSTRVTAPVPWLPSRMRTL